MNEGRTFSVQGLATGAAIGLTSGLAVDYLALLCLRFVDLPWPAPTLNELPVETWFIPVLLILTLIGAYSYGSEG